MLLFGESQVCPPGLPATVADCFRNEFLRIMQISIYNAYENQTIQRGQYTYSTQLNRIANENCKKAYTKLLDNFGHTNNTIHPSFQGAVEEEQ